MKHKPDTMTTMVLLFLLGVVITGFSTFSVGSSEKNRAHLETTISGNVISEK